MCGYCIEHITCTKIAGIQSGQAIPPLTDYLEAISYLEDGPDFLAVLAATPEDRAREGIIPTLIACRSLEMLLFQDFYSDAYQALLKAPAFIAALEVFTDKSGQEGYGLPDADARFDLAAVAWVWDMQTYIKPWHFNAHLQHWTFQDGESLLKQYEDYRLKGIGLHHNDLDERFKQTGVFDPIEDITAEDRAAFAARFPAFWFALYWVGHHPERADALWGVVTQDPIGVPDFEGLELWLQRRAALITYDIYGLAPFTNNLAALRADLFQYIALMRQIPREGLADLLKALDQYEYPDHEGAHFSLRQWLKNGDLQVS